MKTVLAILVSEPGQPDMFLTKSNPNKREYSKDHKKAKKANNKNNQRKLRDDARKDVTPKKPGKQSKKPKKDKNKKFSDKAEVKMVDISEVAVPQRDVYLLPTGTRKDLNQLSDQDRRKRVKILLAPEPEIRTQIEDSSD